MTARMTLARDMEDFVGKYYSKEWFRRTYLDKMKRKHSWKTKELKVNLKVNRMSEDGASSFININRQFLEDYVRTTTKTTRV